LRESDAWHPLFDIGNVQELASRLALSPERYPCSKVAFVCGARRDHFSISNQWSVIEMGIEF